MRAVLSALLSLTLAAPALADETWATPYGEAIYEQDLNQTTILTVPEPETLLRVYIPGLAGNYTDRSTHFGYWIADGYDYCPARLVGEDGFGSFQWGSVILIFDGPAFPTSWTMLLGDCFDTPLRSIRGETLAR